jgi:hypothetical protein
MRELSQIEECAVRAYCAGRSRVSVRFIVESRLCRPLGEWDLVNVALFLDSLGWRRVPAQDLAEPGERTWWWTRNPVSVYHLDNFYLLVRVDRRVSWLAESLSRLESLIGEQGLFEVLPADLSASLGLKGVSFEPEERFTARLPDEPRKKSKKR